MVIGGETVDRLGNEARARDASTEPPMVIGGEDMFCSWLTTHA